MHRVIHLTTKTTELPTYRNVPYAPKTFSFVPSLRFGMTITLTVKCRCPTIFTSSFFVWQRCRGISFPHFIARPSLSQSIGKLDSGTFSRPCLSRFLLRETCFGNRLLITDYCFGNFFPSLSIPFFVTGNLFREPFSCLLSNFTNLINWSLFTFTVFPQETPNGLRRFGVFITHHCSLFTIHCLYSYSPFRACPVPKLRDFGRVGGRCNL